MDRATFEASLQRDGFELFERVMTAGTVNAYHNHPFDARLFVLSGEITITYLGESTTYGPGDTCEFSAGAIHAEEVDTEDFVYLAGRRDIN